MITPSTKTSRVTSIDALRGIIMIIMALDHVRDFFHITAQTADPLDLTTTTPLLFFTRWITHFCAPTFVFLSGISAYLSSQHKSPSESSIFLIKRGIWLVAVDFIIMSFGLTFDPSYSFIMLTVLWAIGCSMILLGILLKLSPKLILPLGLLLFLGHDIVSMNTNNSSPGFVNLLFNGLYILPVVKTHTIAFLYSILPYTGIMLLGYWMGKHVRERKTVFITGLGLFLLFIILRFINIYGDPQPWKHQSSFLYTLLSFVNTTKYPPSLQFSTMVLGPSLMLLAALDKMQNSFQRFASVYGKVPFFYYVIHIYLAHIIVVIAFYATGHNNQQIHDPKSPFLFRPQDFGFSLGIVYLIWLFVVLMLYYPCRWFSNYKKEHRSWWTSYI
ncbi:MAG: DUF1624 domain-containing protein [Ilyomonas sp.]